MNPRTHIKPTPVIAAGLVLLVAFVAAACGAAASSSTPTPSASAASAAADQIKSDWQTFFAGTTPAATKISLLQNGQQFAKTIQAQASSAIAQGTQAKVTAVKVVSPTEATVTYSILIGGQPALTDQTGKAVLEGGTWKVGATSFQALLQLEKSGAAPSPSPSK